MPLVDQHEVVPLERLHGDRPVSHLVPELRDLQDLDRLAGEESPALLAEDLRLDPRRLELAQVLAREPFVRGQQDDAVEVAGAAVARGQAPVLEDVGVHEQRLAAAGGHPERQLVELRRSVAFGGSLVERGDAVGLRLAFVECGDACVQRREQRTRVAEPAVEVDLGEEQGEVLEVLPDDRGLAAGDALLVEAGGDGDDRLIVLKKRLVRQGRPPLPGQVQAQGAMEAVDVVLVQPFERFVAQVLGKPVEAFGAEQAEKPLVQHQPPREGQRGVTAAEVGTGAGHQAHPGRWWGLPSRDRIEAIPRDQRQKLQ